MINRGFDGFDYQSILKSYGFTSEGFLLLPRELREIIIMNYYSYLSNNNFNQNRKTAKEKILTIFNKI